MTEEHAHYTINAPAHEVSIEQLYHFKCHVCQNWWSIGDWQPVPHLYCPHCGIKAPVKEIKQHGDQQ
jgi:hypothetical protein